MSGTLTWIVEQDAVDEVDRLTWLWETTAVQDWKICEYSQSSVCSRKYQPGPYSGTKTLWSS